MSVDWPLLFQQRPGRRVVYQSFVLRISRQVYEEHLTRPGRWFLISTLAFTVYGATSLDIQVYIPFCYAFGVWTVAFLGMLLSRPKVRLTVRHAGRVCAGEILPVEAEVEQRGRATAAEQAVLPHRTPAGVTAVPETGAPVPALKRGEKARVRLGLRCSKRGVYVLPGFRVETAYPFGLLRANRAFREEQALVVYPQFTSLARLEIPSGRRYQPGGVALASTLGDSFEFIGNREYREGDNIREIDWRATARLSRPIVREYREEYFVRVAVVLDTQIHWPPRKGERDSFEQGVSVCAAVSDFMARQEYIVDLFAAGPDIYHLTAGRSLAYLDQILDILACVEPTEMDPFGALEPEIVEHLSQVTTVVCVLLDWDPVRQAFVQRLREQATAVKVIIVRDGPCTLDPSAEGEGAGAVRVVDSTLFKTGIEEL